MQTEPPKAEPPKRKRRWFQFSLRTLMIGVTLLAVPCAYVAHEAKIVRDRKVYLRANTHDILEELAAAAPEPRRSDGAIAPFAYDYLPSVFAQGDKTQAPTGIRIWLGDEAQEFVWVDKGRSLEKKQSVATLFPETDIWEWGRP